jgi:hypothetical protein
MRRWLVLLVVLPAYAACSDDGTTSCDDVGITQGVFGHVMYISDVGEMKPTPVANERIEVLDAPRGNLVANTTSNADGAFELALDTGSYALCPPEPSECVTFSVASGQRVRAELTKTFLSKWTIEAGCE